MKKPILLSLLIFTLYTQAQKITRGPDIGEIYFLGPTHTGTGLYYSTDFGETAFCMDSIKDLYNIEADKLQGCIYGMELTPGLYYSTDFGNIGSWVYKTSGMYPELCSGVIDSYIYNNIESHSEDYGSSFISHSLNGYFGNLLESEIDYEFPCGYAIVFQSGITDSIYLLFTQDNYENIGLQNSFYVNYYSKVDITRGFNNGELYLDLAQNSYTENLLLRSTNYGETFDTIESFNLSNFYQLDFEGGRLAGEIYILYNFVNLMWQNAHTYIYHSTDYGQTFDLYHPFGKGNEPVLANFSTVEKEVHITTPIEFSNFSIGDIQEYQWDFENDGIIDSYEETPVHIYQDTGWYSVKLSVVGIDSTNTFTKENYIHVLDTTTNILEKSMEIISISPNPFENILTITFTNSKEPYLITIYNLKGEKVLEMSSNQSNQLTINTSKLKLGIYVLNIKYQDKSINYKIIKN